MTTSSVPPVKRVVLRYKNGLRQIIGTTAELPTDVALPQRLEQVQYGDHVGAAMFVGVRKHYIVYAEV